MEERFYIDSQKHVVAIKTFVNKATGKEIRRGSVGGILRDGATMEQKGTSWICRDVDVKSGTITEDAYISGRTIIYDNSIISGKARVSDSIITRSKISDDVQIQNSKVQFSDINGNIKINESILEHATVSVPIKNDLFSEVWEINTNYLLIDKDHPARIVKSRFMSGYNGIAYMKYGSEVKKVFHVTNKEYHSIKKLMSVNAKKATSEKTKMLMKYFACNPDEIYRVASRIISQNEEIDIEGTTKEEREELAVVDILDMLISSVNEMSRATLEAEGFFDNYARVNIKTKEIIAVY